VQSAGQILINKLDEFIRRYYKNQLLKGSLYGSGILLTAFLTVTLLEYFGEFNSIIRGILFFGFIGATLLVLFKFILRPLLRINRIGERISYEDAALIIGRHFGNVEDKLLNVLQLQNQKMTDGSQELLLASISQKTDELKLVPFGAAIDLQENKKYLPYLVPLLFITTLLFIVWPHIFSKSTTRLVNYQTYFEKEMPFRFVIANKNLQALQTEDYQLQVKVEGSELPAEVFLVMNGIEYKLEKKSASEFNYTFSNLQRSTDFQFAAAGFLSKEYHINVLPKPSLLDFSMHLSFPAYLHRKDEQVNNTGDIIIPQGTRIKWLFHTRNAENLTIYFSDSLVAPSRKEEDVFSYSRRFMKDDQYAVRASNAMVALGDSMLYTVRVVPDQFPFIEVNAKADSLERKNIYFSGLVRDDYGFSQLTFHYKRLGLDSTNRPTEKTGSLPVTIAREQVSQSFYYFLDIAPFELNAGEKLEYYFEVRDNDGVNGPKAARTQVMDFKAPTLEEVAQSRDKNNSEIKKDLEESISKAKQLQKDINELSKKINEKKQLGYEEQKKLEELLKKQQSLQNKIEEIKKENQQNNQQQNEFTPMDESILEKQKELEKLFENVMTPEMKKLFDELNKMLDRLDKNQVQEKLEELKLTNKDIEKELDRNLEAFRQLEVQQKMQDAIDKLDQLQKKQEDLAKETQGKKDEKTPAEKDKDSEQNQDKKKDDATAKPDKSGNENKENKKDAADLKSKQEEIKKEFEDLKKDLSDLKKKNDALEEPNALPSTEKKEDKISEQMQKSSEQLQKNNKKEAAKSQESASDEMQDMKEAMEKAMQEEEEAQQEENAKSLRQILENLLQLSFAQEELVKDLPKTRVDNPQYVSIPKKQSKLKDDSKIIEDSLLALSKREPKVSAIINREISAINMNMDKTVKSLAERNVAESTMRMQSTMTAVNNLALLLNESLEQMQQQQKDQKESKSKKGGKCKKPGSGTGQKPSKQGSSPANLRKMQEQLNKQLQDLKDAMEKGEKPGQKPGEKPGLGQGNKGGMGLPGSSEQFAKMAAQQEALRRQMQSMMEKLKNKGQNPGGDLANLMEETEKDLVNKQLTNETMRRQQQILTRLLESEKAEQEREQDEKRKSNEAKNENNSNPAGFLEYKRLKEKEMELLNTVPPSLNPYYKEKVNQYFNSLNR